MATADLEVLKKRVAEVATGSAIGDTVADIVLEAASDDEAGNFLRIIIEVKNLPKLSAVDAQKLLIDIEDAVSSMDERYPSVRFAEAA